MNDCDMPLDLKLTERPEVDDEIHPPADEGWNEPERTEDDRGVESDFHLAKETQQSTR